MFTSTSSHNLPPKPTEEKFLIIGLGNPGRDFRFNRHNIGFMLLDKVVDRRNLTPFTKRQGKALITFGTLGGKPVILAKPQTYMNLSGEAVSELKRFYNIHHERILVCVDDIDIPLGHVRLRARGTSGGQRGLQSIIDHLGTNFFPRLRIGIGRPVGARAATDHVLQNVPEGDEQEIIGMALDRAVDAVETFVAEGIVLAMSRHNGPPDRKD
jgi:PTH1 family peptidyl-tRNA hydrolase